MGMFNRNCGNCKGHGLVPSRRYAKACRVLGMPEPKSLEEQRQEELANSPTPDW